MGMGRFTQLTNGFSEKLENRGHMVALYFMHYTFCSTQEAEGDPVMERDHGSCVEH